MADVLLIEPDHVLAKTYFEALTEAGHLVAACHGAQSAIAAADQITPDLVVVELQLVEHSGLEFLYEFRSYTEWQSIPVLVQSVVPPAEFKSSWQVLQNELGVRDYLYKPQVSLRQLVGKIDEHLAVPA